MSDYQSVSDIPLALNLPFAQAYVNVNLEQSLLSALISVENCFDDITAEINVEDFTANRHRIIYDAIQKVFIRSDYVDAILLVDYLRVSDLLDECGGEEYISQLLACPVLGSSYIVHHAKQLRSLTILRNISRVLYTGQSLLSDPNTSNENKIDQLINRLSDILLDNKKDTGLRPVQELLLTYFDQLQKNAKSGVAPFIKTNFTDLDSLAPIQGQDLIVIGARPSMGKTTFGLNILDGIIRNTGEMGLFFSIEMGDRMLMTRLVSQTSLVDSSKLRSGQGLNEHDWENIADSVASMQDLPLFIDTTSGIGMAQIRARCKWAFRKYGKIGAILLDYIQIVGDASGSDNQSLARKLGEITGGLKGLAKEYNCPVIALSQLNRDLERRPNKRPLMSDIRESGAIEQDADHIWFIYRDEVYNENSDAKDTAEIIVGKQREGELGTIRLAFDKKHSRFTNLTIDSDNPFAITQRPNTYTVPRNAYNHGNEPKKYTKQRGAYIDDIEDDDHDEFVPIKPVTNSPLVNAVYAQRDAEIERQNTANWVPQTNLNLSIDTNTPQVYEFPLDGYTPNNQQTNDLLAGNPKEWRHDNGEKVFFDPNDDVVNTNNQNHLTQGVMSGNHQYQNTDINQFSQNYSHDNMSGYGNTNTNSYPDQSLPQKQVSNDDIDVALYNSWNNNGGF